MTSEALSSIRKRILNQRRSLTSENVRQLSDEVISRFLQSKEIEPFKKAKNRSVAFYKAFSNELILSRLESVFREWGWQVAYPRSLNGRVLEFCEITESPASASLTWLQGAYGGLEPPLGLKTIPLEKLDLIFLPGAVFGQRGERVGQGYGFYDRTLPQANQALRVALAYDFQVLDSVEQMPWDQPVHWIVTERREFQMDEMHRWFNEF